MALCRLLLTSAKKSSTPQSKRIARPASFICGIIPATVALSQAAGLLRRVPMMSLIPHLFSKGLVTPGAGNTWYFDAPGKPGQQVETFFIEALVPYIDAN